MWRKNPSRVLYGSCSLALFSRCSVIRYKMSGWLHFKILSIMQQDHSSGGFKLVLLPVVRWADWPLQIWIMDRSLMQPARLKQINWTRRTGSVIIKFLSQVRFTQNDNLFVICFVMLWDVDRPVINKNTNYSWRMKDQLDVTCYFISLIMRSTCFGH